MMLADLLTTLETRGALKPSRVPAIKTSLKSLAEALGHTSLDACPVAWALREEATLATELEDHWRAMENKGRPAGASTRRNTRNNIRKVFTLADAHGLLAKPLPPVLLAPTTRQDFQRAQIATAPYQATYRPQLGSRYFGLPERDWPPDIQEGFRGYRERCGFRIRARTFERYTKDLICYLGYLAHVVGGVPTWGDVFDAVKLRAFVTWHGARVGRPISAQGRQVVITVVAMANVLKHHHADALAAFLKTLKAPAPLHNKRLHMVTLRELDAVADALLAEGRTPYIAHAPLRHPGVHRVTLFQKGVMLKILVRVPLRQRNIRELQLEKHLYKDPTTGHWHLHLRGDDLKMGTRGGRVNEYKLNLSADTDGLVPVLEEFLRDYRPRLPGATDSPFLFLTKCGNPYSVVSLRLELRTAVAMRTGGKRFYPHLIRTIFATECLTDDDKPDWTTVAVMLGDKVGTVMAHYHDLVDQAHHPKAKALVARRLRTG